MFISRKEVPLLTAFFILFLMKYGIYINQKAIVDNGWNIKANHCAVLDVISGFIATNQNGRFTDESGDWYWISNKLILEAIPMFEIAGRRLRQLIKDLVDIGLLETNQNNDKYGRCYLRLGKNYIKYIDFDYTEKVDTHEKNFIAPHEKNFRGPMKNISTYNIINIKEEDKEEEEKNKQKTDVVTFLKQLPKRYYKEKYPNYLDCRGAIEKFISENAYNKFDIKTWEKHLNTKIHKFNEVKYSKIYKDKDMLDIVNSFCNELVLKLE